MTAAPPMHDAPAAPTSCVSGSTATIDHVAGAVAGAKHSPATNAMTKRRDAARRRATLSLGNASRSTAGAVPPSSQALNQCLALLIHFVRQAIAELLEEFADVFRVASPILRRHRQQL